MDYFCLLNDLLIGNALGAVKNDHLSAPFKAIFLKNMLYDLIIFVGIRPQIMAFFFAQAMQRSAMPLWVPQLARR